MYASDTSTKTRLDKMRHCLRRTCRLRDVQQPKERASHQWGVLTRVQWRTKQCSRSFWWMQIRDHAATQALIAATPCADWRQWMGRATWWDKWAVQCWTRTWTAMRAARWESTAVWLYLLPCASDAWMRDDLTAHLRVSSTHLAAKRWFLSPRTKLVLL